MPKKVFDFKQRMARLTGKVNAGSDLLIPKNKWVPATEIQGSDSAVLLHPIMEQAFQAILRHHHPRSPVAFFALCSRQRPYSKGTTWKRYIAACNGMADPIVTSNGGVIPLAFEKFYPFLTYDAHGGDADELYVDVLSRRLVEFLARFSSYRAAVFYYSATKRNRLCVPRVAEQLTQLDVHLLPTEDAWNAGALDTGPTSTCHARYFYRLNPMLHPARLAELASTIQSLYNRFQ